jgi:hypothetical protein
MSPNVPRPENPVIGIVQAELRAKARDLPLRGELCQGQLDQALHLLGKQHPAPPQATLASEGTQGECQRFLIRGPG